MRPGAASISALVAPLVQSRPRFVGCALSPVAFRTVRRPSGPLPMSSTIPHPTPQYEQTVRTWAGVSGCGFGAVMDGLSWGTLTPRPYETSVSRVSRRAIRRGYVRCTVAPVRR